MEEILTNTYKTFYFHYTVNSSFTAMSLSEYRIITLDYIYHKYLLAKLFRNYLPAAGPPHILPDIYSFYSEIPALEKQL